jgi:hypothetical protein
MRLILAWGLLMTALAWMPYGLIDQGRRRINPQAQPLALQLVAGCDPTTHDWRGCK